jgi:hypothetical protein
MVQGIPTESDRVYIDYSEILKWYQELGEEIRNIPREFIFNADETGVDEFVDKSVVSVVVPST